MTPEQIKTLVATDLATTALVDCLVRFMDGQGLLKRAQFIAYLHEAADRFEAQGVELAFVASLRRKAEQLGSEPFDGPLLQ